MTFGFSLKPQRELSIELPLTAGRVRRPSHGRFFEAFEPGQVVAHAHGRTVDRGLAWGFARTFHQSNPRYSNLEAARALGFPDTPVCPLLVFNLVLAMTVQADSERAIANLGYDHASFLRPVYPGDTLRALSRVATREPRSQASGSPSQEPATGVVSLQVVGLNQRDEVVLQFERRILVPVGGSPALSPPATTATATAFPWLAESRFELPSRPSSRIEPTPSHDGADQGLHTGDVVLHANGRTVTDEHIEWTCNLGNTHPLHSDGIFSASQSGPMSGPPIVFGGLAFAWLDGLACRDVSETSIWDLGFTAGRHLQPIHSSDTISALSRVLAVEPTQLEIGAQILTLQLVGVRNVSAAQAFDQHGADLFTSIREKSPSRSGRIDVKIFEVERRFLIPPHAT